MRRGGEAAQPISRATPPTATRAVLILRAIARVTTVVGCGALFVRFALPRMWHGPVVGTGQDEWYNVIRALRVLHDGGSPGYFIHPALYYDLLAAVFGCVEWGRQTSLADAFLADEYRFLDVARYTSLACGVASVAAASALGEALAGLLGGLAVAVFLACLPLAQTLGVSIRVDALGLALMLYATSWVVRAADGDGRHRSVAAVAIGVATAANYPGALLLGPLWWQAWADARRTAVVDRWLSIVRLGAIAGGVFVVLNPYTVLDARQFASWFSFLTGITADAHPHAPPSSVWTYLLLLDAQGLPTAIACALGLFALAAPTRGARPVAALAVAHFAAFSLMRSQYDRFGLPPIALLGIVGLGSTSALLLRVVGRLPAALFVLVTVAALARYGDSQLRAFQPFENPAGDYRATMRQWIEANVATDARLIFESDTLPLVQTACDPGGAPGSFEHELRDAFERRYPRFPRDVLKAQFIAAVYNYSPELLRPSGVYFLASTQNRRPILESRSVLPEPAAFYAMVDARADVVHRVPGFHEDLVLYRTR